MAIMVAELRSSSADYRSDLPARRREAQGFDMDVIVTPVEGGTVWQLTDLLGRSMGHIRASAPHQFKIYPAGHALETMAGILQGPHGSLDAALAEIERHTRGVCRRNPGEDQP
jgi:hypothetical protein